MIHVSKGVMTKILKKKEAERAAASKHCCFTIYEEMILWWFYIYLVKVSKSFQYQIDIHVISSTYLLYYMQKRYFHLLHSFGVSFKLYLSALPPPLKSVRKINSLLFSPSKFALALLLKQSFFLLITALLMVLGIYLIFSCIWNFKWIRWLCYNSEIWKISLLFCLFPANI